MISPKIKGFCFQENYTLGKGAEVHSPIMY